MVFSKPIRTSENRSSNTFSARVCNRNHVGSPHIIVLGFGATWTGVGGVMSLDNTLGGGRLLAKLAIKKAVLFCIF